MIKLIRLAEDSAKFEEIDGEIDTFTQFPYHSHALSRLTCAFIFANQL